MAFNWGNLAAFGAGIPTGYQTAAANQQNLLNNQRQQQANAVALKALQSYYAQPVTPAQPSTPFSPTSAPPMSGGITNPVMGYNQNSGMPIAMPSSNPFNPNSTAAMQVPQNPNANQAPGQSSVPMAPLPPQGMPSDSDRDRQARTILDLYGSGGDSSSPPPPPSGGMPGNGMGGTSPVPQLNSPQQPPGSYSPVASPSPYGSYGQPPIDWGKMANAISQGGGDPITQGIALQSLMQNMGASGSSAYQNALLPYRMQDYQEKWGRWKELDGIAERKVSQADTRIQQAQERLAKMAVHLPPEKIEQGKNLRSQFSNSVNLLTRMRQAGAPADQLQTYIDDVDVAQKALDDFDKSLSSGSQGESSSGSDRKSGGGDMLAQAREAIKNGAPRDAVLSRLKEMKIDASGL